MDEIRAEPSRFLMVFRPSMAESDFAWTFATYTRCIFSRWEGYLQSPEWQEVRSKLEDGGGELILAHTFNQELGTILLQWRGSQPTIPMAGEVLPWERDSLRQLYDDWHAIQAAAGIPDGQHYVPKNRRSWCASAWIAAGVLTVVVKDILGHATVATTETFYINTTPAPRSAIEARKIRVV